MQTISIEKDRVHFEDISEVDSYRKEYAQIINGQGYGALLRKLANPGQP